MHERPKHFRDYVDDKKGSKHASEIRTHFQMIKHPAKRIGLLGNYAQILAAVTCANATSTLSPGQLDLLRTLLQELRNESNDYFDLRPFDFTEVVRTICHMEMTIGGAQQNKNAMGLSNSPKWL